MKPARPASPRRVNVRKTMGFSRAHGVAEMSAPVGNCRYSLSPRLSSYGLDGNRLVHCSCEAHHGQRPQEALRMPPCPCAPSVGRSTPTLPLKHPWGYSSVCIACTSHPGLKAAFLSLHPAGLLYTSNKRL